MLQAPLPHPPLECPQHLLLQPSFRLLAKVLKKRLRLQLRSCLQHPQRRAPDGFQRIFSSPPVVGLLLLFARVCLAQILPRRVAGNPRFHCTHCYTDSPVALENELVDLTTIDHLTMPPRAPSQRAYHAKTYTPFSCNRVVSFNCRQESVLVVATHPGQRRVEIPLSGPDPRTSLLPIGSPHHPHG